jgi:hypothetical protein
VPTVPRRTGLSVAPSALPTMRERVQAPAAAFADGPTLPDVAPLAQAAQALYERERRRADTVQMMEADTKMSALRQSLLLDPEGGLFNQRGRSALEAEQKVAERWRTGVSEIEAGLTTDDQRQRFRAFADRQTWTMREQAARHVVQEVEREDKEVTSAALSAAVDDALANWAQPAMVDDAIAKHAATLTEFARHRKVPEPVLARQLAESRSTIRVGVVKRMLDADQDRAAAEYYATHKAEVLGGHREGIEKALQQGTTEGESQRRADAIMATPGEGGQPITRGAAYEAAKAIDNPEIRRRTEERLTLLFSRRDADERDAYEALTERAWDYLDRGQAVPASVMSELKGRERAGIRAHLKAQASGIAREPDAERYYELRLMAADPATRGEFATMNLRGELGVLGSSWFKQLADIHAGIRAGDARTVEHLGSYMSKAQIAAALIGKAGIEPESDEGRAARLAMLERQMRDQQALGRDLTDKEFYDLANEMLVEGVVSGSGFLGMGKTTKRRYELEPDETLAPPDAPRPRPSLRPTLGGTSAPRATRYPRASVGWDSAVGDTVVNPDGRLARVEKVERANRRAVVVMRPIAAPSIDAVPPGARTIIEGVLRRAGLAVTDSAIADAYARRQAERGGTP